MLRSVFCSITSCGWTSTLKRREAPYWAQTLPTIPRLVHRLLAEERLGGLQATIERLVEENARRNRLLAALLVVATLILGLQLIGFLSS